MPTIHLSDGQAMRLSEERMRDLAAYVVRLIDQGEHERDQLQERWRQSRSDYDNQPIPFVSKIIQDAQDVPQNFAQPRADALGDHIVTSITTQAPFVTCWLADSQERQEHRERTMDFLLRRGKFGEKLKTLAPSVWCTNHGILRLSYGGPECPLNLDPIEPEDFICVGSGAYDIDQSRCVGHRFQRSRGELKLLQKSGRYTDAVEMDDLQPTNSTTRNTNDPKASSSIGSASADEDMVTLWQVYAILDPRSWSDEEGAPVISGRERRFSIVIEPETFSILRIEEYGYRRVCYYSFGFKAPPEKGFWHPRSVGADMQGPHRAYNCLANLATYGTLMTAFPPLVAQHGAFSRDQRYKAGGFVNMEAGDLSVPALKFDLGAIQAELARIERVGDSVARINSAGIARQYSKEMTATEANQLAAGQNTGISGYLESFASQIPALCEHAEEILADTFADWKPAYGSNTPVVSPEDLRSRARWDIPGKVPSLSPQIVVRNVNVLMSILGQATQMGASNPSVLAFGMELLQLAMNAMDLPNADKLVEKVNTPVPPAMGQMGPTGPMGPIGQIRPMGGPQ